MKARYASGKVKEYTWGLVAGSAHDARIQNATDLHRATQAFQTTLLQLQVPVDACACLSVGFRGGSWRGEVVGYVREVEVWGRVRAVYAVPLFYIVTAVGCPISQSQLGELLSPAAHICTTLLTRARATFIGCK